MPLRDKSSPIAALIKGPDLRLVPGAPQTLVGNIAQRVVEHPHGVLRSVQSDETVKEQTFSELWKRSGEIASVLQNCNLTHGCPVVLVQSDILEYVPSILACFRAGLTAVPFASIAATLKTNELVAVIARLKDAIILCDGPCVLVERVAAFMPNIMVIDSLHAKSGIEPGRQIEAEIACLVATSGSNGRVKLASLSQSALLHRSCSLNYSAADPKAHHLGLFPFDGLNGLRALFFRFASWTQLPSKILASYPEIVFRTVERFGITTFQTTNAVGARLAAMPDTSGTNFKLSSLKQVGLGGEAVTQHSSMAFRDRLVRHGAPLDVLVAGYGTTETGFLLAGVDPTKAPIDEAGAIVLGGCAAGVAIRVVDNTGLLLNEGIVGNVEVSASQKLFSYYWDELNATSSAFAEDGWFKTGDLGLIRDGSFAFRGRLKETIVISGKKLSLTDIDAYLQGQVGADYRPISFIMRNDDSSTDGLGIALLQRHDENCDTKTDLGGIRASLVRQFGLVPDTVLVVNDGDVPLTATGKVDRAELSRQMMTKAPAVAVTLDPTLAIHAILEDLWRDALDVFEDFDRQATFEELGGDSLRLATFLSGVDARLGIAISLPRFFAKPTFANLLSMTSASPFVAEIAFEGLWPLPSRVKHRILSFVEGWEGERVTEDRLLIGRNLQGSRPPIFCVFNVEEEFYNLANALGPEQPIYTFRSAHLLGDRNEDLIQLIALRYVQDIEAISATGPIFLLGQCQGGSIALAIAQHLLRRSRSIPLLFLAEWTIEPIAYPGNILLIYGRDSSMNPSSGKSNLPEPWKNYFPLCSVVEVRGTYGEIYYLRNVASIASVLAVRCQAALAAPYLLFGALRGYVDVCNNLMISGWAQDSMHPETPVCLDIIVDGKLEVFVCADEHRPDLQLAGIGHGYHSFHVALELEPSVSHFVEVCRSVDGAALTRSGWVVPSG